MFIEINVRDRDSIVSFDKETGTLLIKCTDKGGKHHYPFSVMTCTSDDARENKNLISYTAKVGERGAISLTDRERHTQ